MLRFLFALLLLPFAGVVAAQSLLADGDRRFVDIGLVDIGTVDSTIGVDLRYSGKDNFMGDDVYGELDRAYLVRQMATRLSRAQRLLLSKGYSLVVLDAARPISVQRLMWAMVEGTENRIYVANPARGGMHNYGAAVDVTMVDTLSGEEADMGSEFDNFSDRAWVGSGHDTPARLLLIGAMREAGLRVYRREWWHYELTEYSSAQIREKYTLLDF